MDALGRARNDEEKPARAAEADVMLQRMSSGHLHGNAHQHTSSLEKDALEALALFGRRQSNDHPGEQASFEFALVPLHLPTKACAYHSILTMT